MGFESFCCAHACGKSRNDNVKTASGGVLNLCAMLIKPFAGGKRGVEVGAIALKIGFAQMPIMSDMGALLFGTMAAVDDSSEG